MVRSVKFAMRSGIDRFLMSCVTTGSNPLSQVGVEGGLRTERYSKSYLLICKTSTLRLSHREFVTLPLRRTRFQEQTRDRRIPGSFHFPLSPTVDLAKTSACSSLGMFQFPVTRITEARFTIYVVLDCICNLIAKFRGLMK